MFFSFFRSSLPQGPLHSKWTEGWSWSISGLGQGSKSMALKPNPNSPILVYKIFLEHSQVDSFAYCPWLASCYQAELSSCDRDHMAHKAINIYYLDLYGMRLPNPGWAFTAQEVGPSVFLLEPSARSSNVQWYKTQSTSPWAGYTTQLQGSQSQPVKFYFDIMYKFYEEST